MNPFWEMGEFQWDTQDERNSKLKLEVRWGEKSNGHDADVGLSSQIRKPTKMHQIAKGRHFPETPKAN